jgi:hypothetical protein
MRIDEQNGKDSKQKENICEKGMEIKRSSIRIRSRQRRTVRNQSTSTVALR